MFFIRYYRKSSLLPFFLGWMLSGLAFAQSDGGSEPAPSKKSEGNDSKKHPIVVFETNKGDLEIILFEDKAPITVENFLNYTKSGFYDSTIFHRVIPGFVIQGGGFTENMEKKETQPPIENEADNGLKNLRGTLSMARTNDKNSATSQFFINLVDNAGLDHGVRGFGYAVYGKIIKGMDVVDAIAKVKTAQKGMYGDVPVDAIIVQKAYVKE